MRSISPPVRFLLPSTILVLCLPCICTAGDVDTTLYSGCRRTKIWNYTTQYWTSVADSMARNLRETKTMLLTK